MQEGTELLLLPEEAPVLWRLQDNAMVVPSSTMWLAGEVASEQGMLMGL